MNSKDHKAITEQDFTEAIKQTVSFKPKEPLRKLVKAPSKKEAGTAITELRV